MKYLLLAIVCLMLTSCGDQVALWMGEYNAQQNIDRVNARLKVQALEMREQGATIEEISKEIKVPESWIVDWYVKERQ